MKSDGRLIILGIDGLCPHLVADWTEAGIMPHLSAIMKNGFFSPLTGENPPLSPPAWNSIFTGRTMKNHGIADFGLPPDKDGKIALADARHRRCYAAWELATRYNRKATVVNVPLSWPPDRINGTMITGMHSPSLARAITPYELSEELSGKFPGYVIDVNSEWYGDEAVFFDAAIQMIRQRLKIMLHLMEQDNPDLFIGVFVAADRVLHSYYHSLSSNKSDARGHNEYSRQLKAVQEIHRELDRCVEAFVDILRPSDTLMIVSDHGFGPRYGDICIPTLLQAANLSTRENLAYTRGSATGAFVNLEGREYNGSVKPSDYLAVIDKIKQAFQSLNMPGGKSRMAGSDIVTWCRNSIHESLEPGWDVLASIDNWGWTARQADCRQESAERYGAGKIFRIDPVGGSHRPEGVFLLYGAGVNTEKKGVIHPDALGHLNILPTALRLLNIPLPTDLEGESADFVINQSVKPIRYTAAAGWRNGFINDGEKDNNCSGREPDGLNDDNDRDRDESREIMKRLKALGYG